MSVENINTAISENAVEIMENHTPADELIVVEQLPVIVQQLQKISTEIEKQTAYALSLNVTEDNYKEIKKIRSGLNASFNDLEAKRKSVKKVILAPYEEFENVYKQYVTDKYKPAAEQLNARISIVEDGLKEEKRNEVREYFDEYMQSKNIDFLSFEQLDLNITLNVSKKSLKERVKATIDKVTDDLAMIDTQQYKAEILVEYKKTLNVSQAILTVTNRMKAIEAEKAKAEAAQAIAEQKAATIEKVNEAITEEVSAPVALDAPTVAETPTEEAVSGPAVAPAITVYELGFRVKTKNIEHLRSIKQLLEKFKEEGLEYEQC